MSLIEKYAFRVDSTTNEHICRTTLVDADTTRNTLRLDGPCIHCQRPQSVTVPAAALIEFGQGGFAQNCFPNLSADDREFLISGICSECWNTMFPPEDDE